MEKKILPNYYLTFDDVLIYPCESEIEPREVTLDSYLTKNIKLKLPFISAAMDKVTEEKMAISLFKSGGLGILHRNCSIEKQIEMVKKIKKSRALVGAACGPFDIERAIKLKEAGVDVLVVDCAHGHNLKVIASAKVIKQKTNLPLIVGNIATREAVKKLVGIADLVKIGIGPGSICTTRIVSGVGVPQLSAIIEVAKEAHKHNIKVIADGGMRTSGDIAKALGAGADFVMLGNLFAGTEEAPGKVVIINGQKYKEYRGMGSLSVLKQNMSSDRYLTKGRRTIAEGVEALTICKGKVNEVVQELASSIQVSFGYVGAKNIEQFQKRVKFVKVTNAGMTESKPHSILIK